MTDPKEPSLLEQLDQLEGLLEARRHVRRGLILGLAALAAGAASGEVWVAALGIASLLYAGFFFVKMKLSAPAAPVDTASLLRDVTARPPEEPPVHPLPEAAGPMREDWVAMTLVLDESRRYRTETNDELELPAGDLDVEFRFGFRPERRDEDDIDVLIARLRVCPASGRWWETETYLDQDALVLPFASAQLAEDNAGRILFWENAPDEWRQAMQSDCCIAGVRGLLDSRERFELQVGDGAVTMMLKYQGPLVDLAWLASEDGLVARASGLVYERWEDGQRDDAVDQVTFGYLLSPREILLPTAPEFHWVEWEEWWEGDEDQRKAPVFRRLDRR